MIATRDQIRVWASTLDEPEGPVVQRLLADADGADARARETASALQSATQARAAAEARCALAAADAARLAQWIIAHPSEHDPTEVLDLHDRSLV